MISLPLIFVQDVVDLARCTHHLLSCATVDGGFGVFAGAEAHAGQTFCCVAALAIAGTLESLWREPVLQWLSERQVYDGDGGANGRVGKGEDCCYAWWTAAAITIAMQGDGHSPMDVAGLRASVLSLQAEGGGFSPRPSEPADVFHTHFAIAALALLGEPGTEALHPLYCMPRHVVQGLERCAHRKWPEPD